MRGGSPRGEGGDAVGSGKESDWGQLPRGALKMPNDRMRCLCLGRTRHSARGPRCLL